MTDLFSLQLILTITFGSRTDLVCHIWSNVAKYSPTISGPNPAVVYGPRTNYVCQIWHHVTKCSFTFCSWVNLFLEQDPTDEIYLVLKLAVICKYTVKTRCYIIYL